MKLKPPATPKIPAEIKSLASTFVNPGLQVPRDKLSMDWSEDIPEVQSSPTPCAPPAGGNMLLPYALLHNRGAKGKRRTDLIDSGPSLLNYSGNQPLMPSSWDGAYHTLSVFGTEESCEVDASNMAKLISRIVEYIKNNLADKKLPAREFEYIAKGFWDLIIAIYSSRWDLLPIKDGKNFRALVGEKILNNYIKHGLLNQSKAKEALSSMPAIAMNPSIPTTPPFSKTTGPNKKKATKPMITKKSYA